MQVFLIIKVLLSSFVLVIKNDINRICVKPARLKPLGQGLKRKLLRLKRIKDCPKGIPLSKGLLRRNSEKPGLQL